MIFLSDLFYCLLVYNTKHRVSNFELHSKQHTNEKQHN